ncbi:ABC transporter permease [Clostridium fessum]|jgi:lipopolysaccharide transport system permease protein|uniref:ABC transporter permease n=2 Tax=Clostridium TaxID=1485 RepID=UPI003AB23CE1
METVFGDRERKQKMRAWIDRINVFMKYKDLLIQLVSRDIKLKYRRSFLGYLWSVLNPLFVMIIMTIVFSTMFSRNIENFPVYLFTGKMLFDFMSTSTNQAMTSVTGNAALLKKTYVPKYIFTLSKVTSCMVDLLFSFGALFIVMLVTRARIYWTFFLFPLVVLQIYIFCCGLGFFLAEFNVFFRDVQYIYQAIITAWMYLTPIFYPVESLPSSVAFVVKGLNPLYYYVAQFRDLVYYGHFPGPRVFLGGWLIAFIMLFFGILMFKRKQDDFILYI